MKERLIIRSNKSWQILLCSVFLLLNHCKAPAMNAADSTYTLLTTIQLKSKFFTTDKLRQIYLVTEKNEVIKYNPEGKELFRYNNNRLGDLKLVDVTDPFNVLLYYADYQTVVTLDRTMSQTGELALLDLNFFEVNAIGMSNDNNIWLYDENNAKLKKVSRNSKIVLESDQLNMVLGFVPKPDFILERENKVYVNDAEHGVLVFDNFGQYIKRLDILGLADFQVIENQLIYRKAEKLKAFHLKTLSTKNIELPGGVQAKNQVRVQKGRLYVQKAEQVQIYSF